MTSTRTFLLGLLAAATLAAAGTALATGDFLPGAAAPAAAGPDGQMAPADQVAFWQRRVDASPTSFLDRTQLGQALLVHARADADLERYEQAEDVLRQAVALNPHYPTSQLALAQSVHAQHRFSEARRIASDVLAAQPDSRSALALFGDANLELGEYRAAGEAYRRLAAADDSPPVISRLSRLAYLIGEPEQALELAEQALDEARAASLTAIDESVYWFQLGHVRFATGDAEGAVEALEQARRMAPGSPGVTEELAFVYASLGRDDEAIELYRALLDVTPAADLHGHLSGLLRRNGDLVGADAQLETGRELARQTADRFPAERRHLVEFLVKVDPGTAVALARADLAERHDVGAYDALAWALHHAGQDAEAAEVVQHVLDSGIQDAAMLYHAGAILIAAGDAERGRALVAAALEINPHFDPLDADAARALLAGST